jgi:hypothetical protein
MDPNASGQGVLNAAAYAGRGFGAMSLAFGLEERYGDGLSLYEYLGSNGWGRFDAGGLFAGTAAQMLLPGPGDFITGMVKALVIDYSENLNFDVAWAGEWSFEDEDHSRTDNTWMALALMRGLYEAFEIAIPFTDLGVNPLDAFGSSSSSSAAARPAKPAGKGGVPSSSGAGKKAKGGWTASTAKGVRNHNDYKAKMMAKFPKGQSEFPISAGNRVDFIDFERKIIYELKPFTPSGIARGAKQPKRYVDAATQRYGDGWVGELHLYFEP